MTVTKKYEVVAGFAKPCETGPCGTPESQSDNLVYVGPNLPHSDVRTCDSLTTVIQKLDTQIGLLKTALYNLTTTTTQIP